MDKIKGIKGLKSDHEGIENSSIDLKEESGDKLDVRVTDGRSPVVKSMSVHTLRTDHDRKEMTSK